MFRKLANPKAPIKSVMVSLQRNLSGFGPNGGMSQCYSDVSQEVKKITFSLEIKEICGADICFVSKTSPLIRGHSSRIS